MGAKSNVLSIGLGSKAWGAKIRQEAKDLARAIETSNLDMARLLWLVYSTPIDNDSRNNAIFTAWGHKSFNDWVTKELGMNDKKAHRLRSVGETIATRMQRIPQPMIDRFSKLGWSKCKELVRIFRLRNDLGTVTRWIETAENTDFNDLSARIKKALMYFDQNSVGETVSANDDATQTTDEEDEDEESDPNSDYDSESDSSDDEEMRDKGSRERGTRPSRQVEEDDGIPLPPIDRTHMFHVFCINEQIDNVREALERAAEVARANAWANSPVPATGHLLSLIAMDFLATNDFGQKGDPKALQRMLSKLEQSLGVKLIAVEENEVVYGMPTLQKLAGD